ncbi:hypothetical protein GQ600_22213 [Phytophthora cactorum]|nr:hypothetical protein GQ600_22213 [Phytophthora cactorum]
MELERFEKDDSTDIPPPNFAPYGRVSEFLLKLDTPFFTDVALATQLQSFSKLSASSNQRLRPYCAVLLALVTLLVSVSAALTTAKSKAIIPELTTSHRTTTSAFDPLGFAKITTTGAQKQQKLAGNVKIKLTSNSQQATDKLFKRLEVGKVKQNIFENPQYKQWAASVTKAYKKSTDTADAAMISTLLAHYGDEPLTKLLADARKSETIDNKLWGNLLTNPVLGTWVSYTDNADQILFTKLAKRYEEGLVKTILAAKSDKDAKYIAKNMETIVLEKWKRCGKTVTDASNLLKLNESGTSLLRHPALQLKGDIDDNIFSILRTQFGGEQLPKIIARSKTVESTNSIATTLELNVWRARAQTPDDIFNLLKLSEKGDDVLESPALRTWVAYVTKLNQFDEFAVLSQLEKRYGEVRLAQMLASSKRTASDDSTKQFVSACRRYRSKNGRVKKRTPKRLAQAESDRVMIDFTEYFGESIFDIIRLG